MDNSLCNCGRPLKKIKRKNDGSIAYYYKKCWKCILEDKKVEQVIVLEAMQIATMAITTLERIGEDDPGRKKALKRVIAWCKKNKTNS